MWPNLQFPADFDTLLNISLMENFIFCTVSSFRLFLTTYQDDLYSRFKKEIFLNRQTLYLKQHVTFDFEFYIQIEGTAMGTIFARTYANLKMRYHGIKVYCIIRQSYALTVSTLKIPSSDFF